jgi:death-on-curing protein
MMKPPAFLSLEQVLYLHGVALARFGGLEGIREPGLISSALASAENTFWYGHGDLFDIAASYAYHLAEAQAFLDGNKRVGAASALTFLQIARISLPDSADLELHRALIAISNRSLDKAALAAQLRRLAQTGTALS